MSLPEFNGDTMAFYAAMAEDNIQREIAERTAERKQQAEVARRQLANVAVKASGVERPGR